MKLLECDLLPIYGYSLYWCNKMCFAYWFWWRIAWQNVKTKFMHIAVLSVISTGTNIGVLVVGNYSTLIYVYL